MTAENSMVERVAEEIAKSDGFHLGLIAVPRHNREVFRKRARAAIEAMREPTPSMLAAFQRMCDDNGACLVKSGWNAMLDAALQRA